VLAVDLQHDCHAAAAEERVIHIQLVEPPEQAQVLCALRQRFVVVRGARQPEQFALLSDAQVLVLWIDP
jgi:hypothetical protein